MKHGYRMFAYILNALLFILCISALNATTQAKQNLDQPLTPHHAVYDVVTTKIHNGAQIMNVTGEMEYSYYPDCEGWVSSHDFNILYEYADSPAVRLKSAFSTYEDFSGDQFSFTSTRKRQNKTIDKILGNASLKKGKGGNVTFTKPENLKYELPPNSYFPIAHTQEILKALKAGRTFHSSVIFDGSDEDGPVLVNAFLGHKNTNVKLPQNDDINADLLQGDQHKIRLAFFPLKDSEDGKPNYEMDVIMMDNGVITDMIVAYDNFTLRQSLQRLSIENSSCESLTK